MPTTGTDIVGSSSEFNQTDWLTRLTTAYLSGKKSLYLSWFCKSDVSGTDNVPWAVGKITGATPLFFRHASSGVISGTPNCWSWGYIFTDKSVRFESPANTGSNNQLQHIACQIEPGVKPRMWINGVEQTGLVTTDPSGGGYPIGGLLIQETEDDLFIGRGSVNSRLWDGLIDELRIIEDVKGTDYALTEYNNLTNIDDFVVFGDSETPSSKMAPRGELIVAAASSGGTTRIKVDTNIINPNPDPLLITAVSAPTIGSATRVDDSYVDYAATGGVGQAKFTVTFSSGGKTLVVPVRVNVSIGGVPPDITVIALESDRVTWDYTPPPGFQGYQPKENPNDGGTWSGSASTPVGTGLTLNKFVLKSTLKPTSRKFLVKPVANGGIESLNAAEISLIDAPPPVGDYWREPNYGSKTRNDVGSHEQLMNAIAGINPAIAYINMTYTDNNATSINRGGTLTNPLIITAQAPNGLTNFAGRAGFNSTVTLVADYVWLDRLAIRPSVSAKTGVILKNNWKFITRCLIDAVQGVFASEDSGANECYVGFNYITGEAGTGKNGLIEFDGRGSGSARPKRMRVYYNNLISEAGTGEGYGIHTPPGSAQGTPDKDYPGFNIDDSWIDYNYIDTPNKWAIYLKHGMDCKYNHIARAALHGISTRGECISKCKIISNRVLDGQVSLQGWHHEIIGNVMPNNHIKLGMEFRNSASTGKFTRGSMFALAVGNQADITLGECRDFSDPDNPISYAPLHDVVIEKHLGTYTRWISDSSTAPIAIGSDGKFPLAPIVSGTNPNNVRYYDRDRIVVRSTTSRIIEPAPVLSQTICGPGSTRGKVWGT